MGSARSLVCSTVGCAATAAIVALGCANHDGVSLSKQEELPPAEIPKVPVPPENGPKLAAIADMTPVLERPAAGARQIGYLHAGDRVPRANVADHSHQVIREQPGHENQADHRRCEAAGQATQGPDLRARHETGDEEEDCGNREDREHVGEEQ